MTTKILILTKVLFLFIIKVNGQYCTSDTRYTEVQYFKSTEITIGSNIQYGMALDHTLTSDSLLLDFYYPNLGIDLSPKRPFIMLFHGGGFTSGNKQGGDIVDLCVQFALRGFVCASVSYRLGFLFSEYGQFKARYRAIQDGHAAMRYVVNNANALRIDTNWLFVGGQSAGSLLALGMVYADQAELDSVSLLYGVTPISEELGNLYSSGNSLNNTYSIRGIFNNWGAAAKNEVDIVELVPTIAFHGELDQTVMIDSSNSFMHYSLIGSRTIHNELIANKICSELTVEANGGHGIYRNASSIFRVQRASCFFKSVFCNSCSSLYTTDSIPSNCSRSLSVDEQNFGVNFKIYPNPIENSFTIEGLDGILDLSLYNCFGQLVYSEEILKDEVQLDLQPGIYFLKISHIDSDKTYITKLIKN
ncbi:MAG: alpha/beta hydrolase fold domain-containing protein [Saprospiraceae bacterium]|nr:alpha/beta hydrolase fold domain-containing protein [Saprospiraceae bacterium]